jgi:uncharacterized protein (TIGR00725 family)
MKQFQIGIMGSAADLNYSNETEQFAKELGRLIAKSNNILVYGAEKEYTSLSTEAAKEASKNKGITVGITGGKGKNVYGEFRPTVLIPCGLEIGGGREFTLIQTCDVIIAISGGSGTLTESATNHTFTLTTPVSGEIEIVYTQTSSKAIYVKSISVEYAE